MRSGVFIDGQIEEIEAVVGEVIDFFGLEPRAATECRKTLMQFMGEI